MKVRCDCPGSPTSPDHGYTDDGEHTYYWKYDRESETLTFRDAGTPVDHPGDPPEDVRKATQRWVEANLTGAEA